MSKEISKKYKKLDHIDHILLRPSRHVGSIVPDMRHTLMVSGDTVTSRRVEFVPAFLKCFDEIIQNSYDHAQTPEGKHLNRIEVSCSPLTGTISIYDNGGIPVVKHSEHKVYIPEMIFGELFSGSNFNDDDEELANKAGGGQNGEGSSLVNVFSKMFKVETADGKNKCEVVWTNNMRDKSKPIITKSKEKFTRVTWQPDFEKMGMTKLDATHLELLRRRTHEIAMSANPIKVAFGGEDVSKDFVGFVKMFNQTACIDDVPRWQIAVMKSAEGFEQFSYVNATNTFKGGPHIDHVMDAIVKEIREHIKKKTKQDVRPVDIKSHFSLVMNCTIDLPRYNSQTKEELDMPVSKFGTRYTPSKSFIAKIIKSDIVESIIEWALRKQQSDEDKEAKKLEAQNAKANINNIIKYETAISKDRSKCMLLITEGDSAAKPLQSARLDTHGIYPLKGKPLNVHGASLKEILSNAEFADLVRILGLSTTSALVDACRYGRGVCVCTDADLDGIHIRGLFFNIIAKFWPDMYAKGMVHILNTPVAIVTQKKDTHEFFTMEELDAWTAKQKTNNYQVRYLKGLGSNTDEDFKRYLADDKYMETMAPLTEEDLEALDLAFNDKRADDRKEWLG